jgi:putative membrane protein
MEIMPTMQGIIHGPYGGWGGPPGPFIFFPFLFSALLLALLAWLAFRFLPRWRDGDGLGLRGDRAEEILRERFAHGETTGEEYVRSMQALRKDEPRGYEDYVRKAKERSDPDRGAGS